MTELICIVCPKGCHLKVDEENGYAVAIGDVVVKDILGLGVDFVATKNVPKV